MPIKLACTCGKKFTAKDSLAGKTVKCPNCGRPLTVTAAASPAARAADGKSVPPKTGPRRPDADEESGPLAELLDEVGMPASRTGRRCPECFSDMTSEAIICIQCGYNTETGRRLRTRRDIVDRGG
jgi:predicted amidophosphoribosyltransferase